MPDISETDIDRIGSVLDQAVEALEMQAKAIQAWRRMFYIAVSCWLVQNVFFFIISITR